jgi:hypothetical protein
MPSSSSPAGPARRSCRPFGARSSTRACPTTGSSRWWRSSTSRSSGSTDRLLISRAGDWTGPFIDDPPSHVWVRGIPVSTPMAKVAVLYQRVVYVVAGSGIGPCLGQILANRVDARLVWSTRDPRATYGDALVDEVLRAQPDALIWDTTERGKPDLLWLAREACRDFDAEPVFVVSNKPATVPSRECVLRTPSGRAIRAVRGCIAPACPR